MKNPYQITTIRRPLHLLVMISVSFFWQPPVADGELLVMPSSEKRLIKKLVGDYEKIGKIGRPVRHTKDTIVVGYGLALFQILDFDVREQVVTINVWSKYTWVDQLLQWDPSNYSNIREVRIPPKLVWTPDIALHNYVDERLEEHRDVMLTVDYSGRVFWSPPAIFKSNCHSDLKYFPFDYQFCFLKFASQTENVQQLDLQFLDNRTEVDIDQYTPNNAWHVVARPAVRFLVKADCYRTTPVLWFFLYLQRNPAFYAYILVFPCILLSLLNTVIFWLPPQNPSKMLLSMNIFVGFSLMLKILASAIPSASVIIPMLGYFYCLNMALISISTFSSTVIINMHFHGMKRGPVPQWLLKIVYKLSNTLSIGLPIEDDELNPTLLQLEEEVRSKTVKALGLQPAIPVCNMIPHKSPTFTGYQCGNLLSPNILNPSDYQTYLAQMHQQQQKLDPIVNPWLLQLLAQQPGLSRVPVDRLPYYLRKAAAQYVSLGYTGLRKNLETLAQGGVSKTGVQCKQSKLHSVKLALQNVMIKVRKKDQVARRNREWRLVIMTIDRLLFWIYLIILISTACYLLIPRGEGLTVDERISVHHKEYVTANSVMQNKCYSMTREY